METKMSLIVSCVCHRKRPVMNCSQI